MKTQYLALMIGTALLASPAFAQSSSSGTSAPLAANGAQSANFITQQTSTQWRAYKMVGMNVYDLQNNKIGDIKDILLDHNGNAQAVVIGVGGFLGIGEKSVAVPFKSLDFKMEPMRTASSAATTNSRTTMSPGGSTTTTTTTAPSGTTTGAGSTMSTASANMEYPDHAVLSMTKDQLKAAPDFHYANANSKR